MRAETISVPTEKGKTMLRNKNYKQLIRAIENLNLQLQEIEYRPCYVNGRKAVFHRWVNTANPALPRGMSAGDDKARFFQHRSTTALVEYADGTVDRVWPQDIRFADGGRFKTIEWLAAGQLEELECKTKNG